MKTAKTIITELFKSVGITVNGTKPFDITVHNDAFYKQVLADGSLGLGESYMAGHWDCKHLDQFFDVLCQSGIQKSKHAKTDLLGPFLISKFTNMQDKKKSLNVAEEHYNLGNDFYENMLDKHMQYTCAYWDNAKNLQEAQDNKLDLVCRKIGLKKGDTVLELGSGWGGFARFAANNYGAKVTCYNISKEQVAYAIKHNKGLPIQTNQKDYRDATGVFDHVVSIGLMEHVGHKNFDAFFNQVQKHLRPNGLFLLHTIGANVGARSTEPWIAKYIFQGGYLPSLVQLTEASEGKFILEDVHVMGASYDKTLMSWYEQYKQNWTKYEMKYPKHFERMWDYYLLSCVGSFRARNITLWQFVFSPKGVRGGYESVR